MAENTRTYASSAQLWRLNAIGLLRIVDYPDEQLETPLTRIEAKEILLGAAAEHLWEPKPARGQRGEHQWASVGS
jgi:hypothetical protein